MYQPTEPDAAAMVLHRDAVIVDCLMGRADAFERVMQGGVTAINITVGGASHRYDFKQALKMIVDTYDLIELNRDKLLLVETAADIERAKREGKLGIIIGFQGALPLGHDLELVHAFHRLGLRILGLTYSEAIAVGSGCTEPYDDGLTYFGRQVVRECERLGVLVDLSHVGERTCWDVLEMAKAPVIFSHSNARAIAPNKRNISDELIRACADTGGVVGVSSYSSFTGPDPDKWPTLEHFLDMIEHVVSVAGIQHTGIGTDLFEGRTELNWRLTTVKKFPEIFKRYSSFESRHVQGFTSAVYYPRLTAGLLRRGFSETEIRAILGGNWMRVFRHVWDKTSAVA